MKVRHVVVVGGGVAPAIAALAIARAYRRGEVAVTWVETPSAIPAHSVLAGSPNLAALHRLLGLHTGAILRAAKGTLALGRQYCGFAGGTGEYLHSYGPVGRPVAGLPFMQLWLKARAAGLPASFADFAREAVAARHGRVRVAEARGMPPTAHGFHLDERGYSAVLRGHAAREGVTIASQPDARPVVEGGRVTALRLADGSDMSADFIVDATATASILAAIGDRAPADAAVSSCNRMLTGSGRPLAPLPLYSRVTAHRAGWSALHPLQDRTAITIAFDDRSMDAREALSLAPLPFMGEVSEAALTPMWRQQPWIGNVVAIGAAAGSLEPHTAAALHRVQIAVTHLVSLFPVRAEVMPEAAIYNEEMGEWHARLQDFAAAPYALNQRQTEPFWDDARRRPVSQVLQDRIALFAARGMVAQYNQDSLTEEEWQTCFLGLGIEPRAWDPQVDRVDEEIIKTNFLDQLAAIRADVTAMDTHETALAGLTR